MNAKLELLDKLNEMNKTIENVLAINIKFYIGYDIVDGKYVDFELIKINVIGNKNVINNLDVEYYAGFGSQQLRGVVLLDNNDWLERQQYDGSEWWEYRKCPTVEELLK
jgi:hypothetical protein